MINCADCKKEIKQENKKYGCGDDWFCPDCFKARYPIHFAQFQDYPKWFIEQWLDTELAFPLSGPKIYERDMPNICPVYHKCPIVQKENKCHGVVWCTVYNGGWGESHGSLRHEHWQEDGFVDALTIKMMDGILEYLGENA